MVSRHLTVNYIFSQRTLAKKNEKVESDLQEQRERLADAKTELKKLRSSEVCPNLFRYSFHVLTAVGPAERARACKCYSRPGSGEISSHT